MLEKTTDRRLSMNKAGARSAGRSDGDTPASPPTSSELIIHSRREAFLEGGV
jgi:hypothetical protein